MTKKYESTVYKDTGFGRPTGPRKPGPATDSLPHHECPTPHCGTTCETPDLHYSIRVWLEGPALYFCSWGCVGRYAAIRELRS